MVSMGWYVRDRDGDIFGTISDVKRGRNRSNLRREARRGREGAGREGILHGGGGGVGGESEHEFANARRDTEYE